MKKGALAAMIVVALLIGLVAGFYLAGMSKNASIGSSIGAGGEVKGDYKDTFKDGWRAAKEKLEKTGFYSRAMYGDKNSISGSVKEVNNGKIVIDTPLNNPLDDDSLKTRTVSLASGAKISLRKLKSPQDMELSRSKALAEVKSLEEEVSALDKKLSGCVASADLTNDSCIDKRAERDALSNKMMMLRADAFSRFQEFTVASLSDIKPGYFVVIKVGEDVSLKTEFSATEIEATENEITMPVVTNTPSSDTPVAPTAPTPIAAPATPATPATPAALPADAAAVPATPLAQ